MTTLTSAQCAIKTQSVYVIYGVLSLVSDLYLVILPLPAVWGLQLPLGRKLAVSAMFLTGSV